MNRSGTNISKLTLIFYIVGFLGLNPVLAAPVASDKVKFLNDSETQTSNGVQLRGTIDDIHPSIQLKGGVKIDKNNQVISLNLRDSDVKQVLRMFADKAGMNIVFHDSVNGKITLDLVKVSLNKAFEYVMTISGLTYWQDGNSLIVASKGVASGLSINKTQLKPIQIKYLDAASVVDFLNTNIFSINRPDISVNQVAISNPRTNQVLILGNESDYILAKKTVEIIDVKPDMKTFNVNYSNPEEIASNICLTVFNSGGGSTGSSSEGSSSGSGSSSTSGSGSGASGQIGTRVICKSTAATNNGGTSDSGGVASSSGNSTGGFTGINITPKPLVTNGYSVIADFNMNQLTISGSQQQIDLAEDLIKRFDKKEPQVYIEVSIIELSESGSKRLAGTMSGRFGTTTAAFAGSSTTINDISGILRNLDADSRRIFITEINSLVEQRKGKVLANPRIIATNNRTSQVNISSDYVQTRTVEILTCDVLVPITETTYSLGEAGIKLDITPKISSNGYVNINMKPSYTAIKEQVKEDDQLVATLLNRRDLSLNNIRIRDGETLILGGLVQETDTKDVKKVPILGDIPVIGALFRDSSTERTKSELILMITPKILQEDEVSAI